MKSCRNCQKEVISLNKYCPNCGQKVKLSSLSVRMLITDFLSNFLNVESKIWKTLKDIWVPAKLTTVFIEGKRISYYNPLRIFIIALFTFFTLFVLRFNDSLSKLDRISEQQKMKTLKVELESKFDSLVIEKKFTLEQTQLVKQKLFDTSLDSSKHKSLFTKSNIDSSAVNKDTTYHIEVTKLKSDSLIDLFRELGDIIESEMETDTTTSLNAKDFLVLSEEEFEKKLNPNNKIENAFFVPSRKLLNNPSSSIKFIIGNGTWAILVLILLMALLFKLFYFRHNYLYAEHFLFHLYGHTRILLLSIFLLLLYRFKDFGLSGVIVIILIGSAYLYLGMKKFYQQSRFKTFTKFLMTLGFYSMAIIFCNLLILGISYLVF